MNVLWIGFGKMGEPMAGRVAAAGHAVSVSDLSPERREAARTQGFDIVDASPETVAKAEVIATSLPNDAAALALLADESGVLAHAKPGTLVIETSTISVAASSAIARHTQAKKLAYVSAPVSGSITAAHGGTLTTFVSGTDEALARAKTVIGAYASNVVTVGDADQARVMKLAVNLMVSTLVGSLCEAYALCRKGGITPKVALDAIGASAIGSPHLRFKADYLERGDFTPTFTVAQMRKDMQLITQGARDLSVPVLLGAAVEQLMVAADARGYADEDYLACAKVVAGLAGLTI